MQQRDRAIPQLSCALCRDRKLKCDKLDPCTNCTSSGVTCVPVYRPRLPRGRHARRSRENSSSKSTTPPQSTNRRRNANDAGTAACMSRPIDPAENPTIGVDPGSRPRSCLERLDTVVQGGDVLKMMDGSFQEAKGDPVSSECDDDDEPTSLHMRLSILKTMMTNTLTVCVRYLGCHGSDSQAGKPRTEIWLVCQQPGNNRPWPRLPQVLRVEHMQPTAITGRWVEPAACMCMCALMHGALNV